MYASIILLLATRYNPSTDIAEIPFRISLQKDENKFWAKKALNQLLAEAWKADPNYIPIEKNPADEAEIPSPEPAQNTKFVLFRINSFK